MDSHVNLVLLEVVFHSILVLVMYAMLHVQIVQCPHLTAAYPVHLDIFLHIKGQLFAFSNAAEEILLLMGIANKYRYQII